MKYAATSHILGTFLGGVINNASLSLMDTEYVDGFQSDLLNLVQRGAE